MSGDGGVFGARLRASRRSAGLSQQELAERSGLSVRTISDLERGRTHSPYQASLHRLADALELRGAGRAQFIAAAGRRLARPLDTSVAEPEAGGAGQDNDGRIVPRHLPAAPVAFVGRGDQLAALSRVLRLGGRAAIAVISGTAGVGKTALAVRWAQQVAAAFPDGQLFVNLRGFDPSGAPVTPDHAARVFLEALGIPADRMPRTAEAQFALYRSLLAAKRVLVVLDNARDAGQVRPLLPGSPTCRAVVTSRNQLTGLAAIEASHLLTLDVLTSAEAHQLLQQRVGAGRLAAAPGAAEQIVSSCACLPLALCIVAARAAMRPGLSLTQVAAALLPQPGLDAFTAGDDPAADVRAAFSWSYRLLDVAAARAFRLAGLHPGPDLDRYALAALTGTPVPQASQVLDTLARACLILPSGQGRYGLHDLLRGYARELAAGCDGGRGRAALTHLFDYYLHATAAAMDTVFPAERHRRPCIPAPRAPGPSLTDEAAALAWLAAERSSLVAAAVHAAGHGWPSHATRLSATLFRYLDTAGQFPEAITIHRHAARAARDVGDRAAEAYALIGLGLAHGHQGRLQQAAACFGQSLARCRETGDQDGQGRALNYLGLVRSRLGRYQEATRDLQQSAALFRVTGDRTGGAYALSNLGIIELRQGQHRQAISHQRQALALFQGLGDRHGEASVLSRLGLIDLDRGQLQQAGDHLRRAMALYRQFGDRQGEASVLAGLGLVDLRQGRQRQAISQLRQALTHYRRMGDGQGEAVALNGLGEALIATGRPADACARYAAAAGLAAQAGDSYERARAHAGLASARQTSRASGQADSRPRGPATRASALPRS